MKADRLLSVLLLLQARGRVTERSWPSSSKFRSVRFIAILKR